MNRFDEIIDRKDTNCIKHDFHEEWKKPLDCIPLWVADMDFPVPEAVTQALIHVAQQRIYGYSGMKKEYDDAVINWFKRRFGWKPQPEWIVKTPGVVFAISSAVRAFTKPGDAVIIQQPVYYPFVNCVVKNGRKLVNNELVYENGRYRMDLEDFERKIVDNNVKLFILCSPHNPVGRVWTRGELEAAAGICLRHGVFVVSDEIHCDFTYEGHPHTVFADISEECAENCMVCTAPSKTFNLAGLQCSNVFIKNQDKKKQLADAIFATGYDEINIMGLAACRAAYENGEEWLEELKGYLAGNTAFVREYIESRIPRLKLVEPEGTYLLWVDCSGLGLADEELEDFMVNKAKLWLDGGAMFGTKTGQFQRINIASPRSVIQKAMEQLRKAAEEL